MATIQCTLGRADKLIDKAKKIDSIDQKMILYSRALQIYIASTESKQEDNIKQMNATKASEVYKIMGDVFLETKDQKSAVNMYKKSEIYSNMAESLTEIVK